MKGLILKDIYLTKGYIRSLLIVVFGFLLMGLFMEGFNITFYIPFLAIMICISTFNYDDFNKWNGYVLTFPISRKNIVKSKYIFTLIVISIATALGMIGSLAISIYNNNLNISTLFMEGLIGLVSSGIATSILYPLIYKFGAEKGRYFVFILIFGIAFIGSGLIALLSKAGMDFTSFTTFFEQYGIIVIVIIFLVLLYISYRLSSHFFTKKEY